MKYFSFCLYDQSCYDKKKKTSLFWEYFNGFKKNCMIIKKHFPNWKIFLFLDTTLKQYNRYKKMYDFIDKIGIVRVIWENNDLLFKKENKLNMLNIKPSFIQNNKYYNSFTLKRYYALGFDYDVLIIRDTDQLISDNDILNIKKWLDDDSSKYLLYVNDSSNDCQNIKGICGGGFATKSKDLRIYFDDLYMNFHLKMNYDNIIEYEKLDILDFFIESRGFTFDEYYIWYCLNNAHIIDNFSFTFEYQSKITYYKLIQDKKNRKCFSIKDTNKIIFNYKQPLFIKLRNILHL